MDNIEAVIVYHANCLDGFAAALAAWLKYGDNALYLPARYDNEDDIRTVLQHCQSHREVIIVDFSFPLDVLKQIEDLSKFVTMLDHHKTAFEMFNAPLETLFEERAAEHYYFLDNTKSGCLLTWEYFWTDPAPLAFQHIDDRDRWQFKMHGTKEFNAALWNHPRNFAAWWKLFWPAGGPQLYQEGEALLKAQANHVEAAVKRARPVVLLGQKGLIVNSDQDISEIGHALCSLNNTFGMIWHINSTGNVACSLRSNGDYDVSAIAKQFGGGGHKNAAGFKLTVEQLAGLLTGQ